MSNSNSNTKNQPWSPVAAISSDHAGVYARLFCARYPDQAEKCNGRIEKAVVIMARIGARRLCRNTGLYEVESDSGRGWYQVDLDRRSCTCVDAQQGNFCKHRLAVGLQIHGPAWLHEWLREHSHRCFELGKMVEAAWVRSNGLATIYENLGDQDINSPHLEDARSKMIAATEYASDLQLQWNALIVEKP